VKPWKAAVSSWLAAFPPPPEWIHFPTFIRPRLPLELAVRPANQERRFLCDMGPQKYLTQAGPIAVSAKLRCFESQFPFDGRSGMEFVDRLLTCADCGGEFIFTAGEQLFFLDKQFKNDPKRCKPCKSRRSAQVASPAGGPAAAGISRTETRTECSECGISTTVPFKPTQGRPVLCRQCFKNKRTPVAAPTMEAATPAVEISPSAPQNVAPSPERAPTPADMAAVTHAIQA
jgi:CxxC-x17-CxxC domain-containing protein